MPLILLVDDDHHIVRLSRSYLEQAGFTVYPAYDGETALHAARRDTPDLMVLDVMLPKRDGWEVLRALRADTRLATLPVLMLTARVEDQDKIHGLELGADDYLTKPFNPQELVARVRAILRRANPGAPPPRLLHHGALTLNPEAHTVTRAGQPLDLTPTEFALLHAFMAWPGHAFTRAELIEKALGYTYEGFERTLDSHIKNLRRKIEPDPAHPTYIETVFGVGYRLNEAP